MPFKDLVEECCVEPGYAEQAAEEGWWDPMLLKVENEEAATAIKSSSGWNSTRRITGNYWYAEKCGC